LGAHEVVLKAGDAIDSRYAVNVDSHGTVLNAVLWSREPKVTRLRPALPGAVLSDARFLADGELVLTIGLPPGRQMEAWRLDPRTGALAMIMDDIWGARVSVAPNGLSLAYLGTDVGPSPSSLASGFATAGRLGVVWVVGDLTGASSPTGWRAPLGPGEQLVDVNWSPEADRLVVFATGSEGDARHTRAWFVDANAQTSHEVTSIPSDVIPGAEAWSPDGRYVAFIAHTSDVNALCLLGIDGTFRYVADLQASSAGPLAYAPLVWSEDGQHILFVAPYQHQPGVTFDWLQPETRRGLYVASVDEPTPMLLADTPVDAATWREDGQFLGLWQSGSESPLSIRLLNSAGGSGQNLLDLPLKAAKNFGVLWDLAHADLLIAFRGTGGTEFWLTRLATGTDS
jgi:hypothetical protein